jgi:hypothetical protein
VTFLPPLEAEQKMEVLKHYFGIAQTKESIARRIELGRHVQPFNSTGLLNTSNKSESNSIVILANGR